MRVEGPEGAFLPVDLLRDGARELGIELTEEQVSLFDRFAMLLVQTNESLNLTRITEPSEIVTNHYFDSLTCITAVKIKRGARVVDIGTGAGFPGIPIKIARPDLNMMLMDSSRKKLEFIESAVAELGIQGITLVHSRAEDAGRDAGSREGYDVAFARAVAEMRIVAELALPLAKVGGMLIVQKSEGAEEEIDAARPIIGQLGGRIDKIERIRIPGTDILRLLVVVSKLKPTPPEFPRPYAKIAKSKR